MNSWNRKHRNMLYALVGIIIIGIVASSMLLFGDDDASTIASNEKGGNETNAAIAAKTQPVETARETNESELTLAKLIELYGNQPLIDAHNHGASRPNYDSLIKRWSDYGIDRIVLFGAVSEPSAVTTDETTWKAYEAYPDVVIPFFSGIDLHDSSSLETVREKLERGYFGIGEIAAASSHSPVLANVPWKTEHPMDGFLPQIYELCAVYKAPLLLHIDPPNGMVIDKLEEALTAYPDTTFIFAHANAFNSPDNVRRLLEEYPNLYADFYAGFTAFNEGSTNSLEDFVEVIREFPDRFLLSTDSGFGLRNDRLAIEAMYRLIHLLDDEQLARQIAYDNLDALINKQPATKTQLQLIEKLDRTDQLPADIAQLTKIEAGLILLGR